MWLDRIFSARAVLTSALLLLSAFAWSLPDGIVRIHYNRVAGDYDGWGLHVWGDALQLERKVTWGRPLAPAGTDGFGIYFDVPVSPHTQRVGFIVHRGSEKNVPEDMSIDVSATKEIWHLQEDPRLYPSRAAAAAALAPKQKSAAARAVSERENNKREAALKADMLALAKQVDTEAKKKEEELRKKEEEEKRKLEEEEKRRAAERERLIAQTKAQRDAELAQSEQERYRQQEQALKEKTVLLADKYAQENKGSMLERQQRLSPAEQFALVVGGGLAVLVLIFLTVVMWQRKQIAARAARRAG